MHTRRHALTLLLAPALLPGLAFAEIAAPPDRRFVLIILRGAMDGLGAVPPLADPDYATLRAKLALGTPAAPNGAVPLDARFWLHPALAPLLPLYQRREMAVLHAIASPYRERSHFDAQNMLESGLIRPGAANDGWLNRALTALAADRIRGIAFTPELPLVLKGRAPVSNWQPEAGREDLNDQVARMYAADPLLARVFAQGVAASSVINAASAGAPRKRDFPSLCAIAARTLAADDGPNVAVLEIGGWDTHVGQGTAKGRLANALGQLAAGVMALSTGMGPRWGKTIVAALTEFGRTAHPNGTDGTDHGTATAAFLFGGALAGGRVIADWPGLSEAALYQKRDLAPTSDVRGVLKSVLGDHLHVTTAALEGQIFPGSAGVKPMPGLVRA
jgi:X-X-X-Leu-X-X-Gly heptad repeat protein